MGAHIVIGYIAAWVWVALPFLYWYTAPEFWRTRTGRSMMWLLASTSGLFFLLLTGRAFGEYPGREVVQAAVYSLTLGAGLRVGVLFFQLRNELYRREDLLPIRRERIRNLLRRLRGRTVK